MELIVDTIQEKMASNKKAPGQNRLKNFNIPKITLDKVILTECFANKREYDEVKQCLIQGCLAKDNNFERWPIEKIEMLQNKHLEEEFVMKRSRLRQERKPDKELPCFLVVAKDDVSKICQSGLHIGQNLKIMDELGNRHLGVYLFRHVDIALKYAAIHSSHIENVIIFRVLLGKVKRFPPAKNKKKIALDPTPNFDCHMSTVHPSVKDLLENQVLGSLVYVYEYNELAKPVDRPRQCLPYAVVKIKCVNLKMHAGFTLTPSKSRPKGLPKRVERDLPLENCTRVTRIVIQQMLKNWRKGCQFRKLNMQTNLADREGQSTKHNIRHSQAWNERPANVTLGSNLCSFEENNGFPQSKKKKKQ
nr:PREDICTED: testis-expressed sequence 15 protein [Anolis carolinensis]|eukprot:XP_016851357.1 PREDICTED: testis-expressed sequence 15 protein [Anolis carolinensis]